MPAFALASFFSSPCNLRRPACAGAAGLALALFAGPSLAQAPIADELRPGASVTMELKNAEWFDGQGFRSGTLYVKDGKFTSQKIKKAQRRMNLKGQFLIPPLADAHNHNLQNAWAWGRYGQGYLRDGVFYALMQCAEPKGAGAVRPLAAAGAQAAGPELVFVTACITSSDGQPLAQLLAEDPNSPGPKPKPEDHIDKTVLVMDSLEQVEKKWPLVQARKSEALKLMLSRSESPELHADPKQFGRLGLKPELPAAIAKKALQDRLLVIAQADTAADFNIAVQAGAHWIARLPGLYFFEGTGAETYRISPEMAAEAARRKVAVITATAASEMFRMPPEQLTKVRAQQADNLRTLQAAGVPLLLGSDLFNGSVLGELRNLDRLGVIGRPQLLKMATITTPHVLFPKRRLGCFEPGCEASFLLLPANPIHDLDALSKIQMRVRQGRVLGAG